MKKILSFMIALCLLMQVNINVTQAAPVVGKTSITSVKQVDRESVKVVWKNVKGVKGYTLQYKQNESQWISKNVKKASAILTGLNNGQTYQFRVCAYKNIKGKKKCGKFSVVKKKSIENYIYLTELYTPYNSSYYDPYTSGKFFEMGGMDQKNGFILGQNHSGVEKKANFNIEGKYSKLTFDVGKVDGASNHPYDGDFDVSIYSDGELIKTVSVEVEGLPVSIEVPLENTERLTFEVEEDACTLAGFSNVKLYFN